jgi:hypothetical protein
MSRVFAQAKMFSFVLVVLSMNLSFALADQPCAPMTLDRLPLLPRNVTVHQFSSHNKKGLNGDADWHLYKDEAGDTVVFDAAGPGCLRSSWMTLIAESQKFKFYFDGEKKPRYEISALDFFQGKHPLFPAPLNSYSKVGYYGDNPTAGNSFVPVPFAKSLKIAIQGSAGVNHFLYEKYPQGTPVTTFTGKEDREYLLQAFAKQGEELQPAADAEVIRSTAPALKPGESFELLNVQKPGTVVRVVLEGEASDEFLRQAEIVMQWDDSLRPDVLAPVGIFFGDAVHAEDVRSLPLKVEKLPGDRIRLVCYFRMPFWRKGQISLLNRSGKVFAPIAAEVHLAPARYAENEAGYFNALYHDGRTEMGRDWLFCEAAGAGRFVGAVQTMYGSHYCEGNEHFAVDGNSSPQVIGTGSEDYYLGCFWPNRNFNMPFAGCVGDIVEHADGPENFRLKPNPACYYRFHLDAPISFYRSFDARIQHGGRSDIISHYQSVGYYYLRKRPILRQTDMIDVANEASESAHGYKAADSTTTDVLEAAYEGNADETLVRDRGRTHSGGEIAFTVAADPKNEGVRLRRRLDQSIGRQSADVYVDGQFAGTWYDADQNPFLRWSDSEFDLPPDLTRGKTALNLRLVVNKDPGYGAFTDYRYEVFVYE